MYVNLIMLSRFSHVQLFATLFTIAHQVPLPVGFPWQEYWSGLPRPPPEGLLHPGIESASSASPALQVEALPLSHWRSPNYEPKNVYKKVYSAAHDHRNSSSIFWPPGIQFLWIISVNKYL